LYFYFILIFKTRFTIEWLFRVRLSRQQSYTYLRPIYHNITFFGSSWLGVDKPPRCANTQRLRVIPILQAWSKFIGTWYYIHHRPYNLSRTWEIGVLRCFTVVAVHTYFYIIPASHCSWRRSRSKNIIRYINRTTIRSIIIYFIIIYKIVLYNYACIGISAAAASRTAGVGNNNIIIVDITVHL